MPQPATELLATPHGVQLEYLMTGGGDPVTVFAHGLGQTIGQTRPLGSAVSGRKVFFGFRGHGRSAAPPGRWSYQDLARDLRMVADSTAATRALGVSLGAGALCRLLADYPDRFERVVFLLPAALDTPRGSVARQRLTALLVAVRAGDPAAIADVVALEIPAAVRNTPAGWAYLRERIETLQQAGLSESLLSLTEQAPVTDRSALRAVRVPALVLGCLGDDLHPAAVAEQLAAALPQARLHIFDKPGVRWTNRGELRERIAGFLAE